MAELERRDIWSDELLRAPLEYSKNLEEAVKSSEKLINLMKESEKNLQSASTISKVSQETKTLATAQTELETVQKRMAQAYAQESRSLDNIIEKRESLKRRIREQLSDQKEDLQLLKDGIITRNEYNKRLTQSNVKIAELKQRIQTLNKDTKQEISLTRTVGNEYQKLTIALEKARNNYKNLAASGTASNDQLRKQQVIVENLNKRVSAIDGAVGQFQRNVGNYPGTFKAATDSVMGLMRAFGFVGGLLLFTKLLKDAVALTIDYEYQNSRLSSVLGASAIQAKELRFQQQELGKSTEFTAGQYAKLQLELAKLGFPVEDIKQMTQSTAAAALAMGSELNEQAALTGATLRAFGLQAEETARVNDVLAASTSRSGLDFQKLATAMPYVAANARALGISLEGTSALMGILANNGFQASTIGTTLRNIFLKLADSSSNLGKRLKEPVTDAESLIKGLKQLQTEGIDLAEAFELTDQRAVSAFLTLVNGADDVKALEKELNNAAGTAESMAKIMGNNLRGDVIKFKSAWEGLILSMTEGDSLFSKLLRSTVQFGTALIGVITPTNRLSDAFERERVELNVLVGAITNANTSTEARKRLMDELNTRYPDFLKNMKEEEQTNDNIRLAMEAANKEFKNKIILQAAQEELQILGARLVKTINDEVEAQKGLNRIYEAAGLSAEEYAKALKEGRVEQQIFTGQGKVLAKETLDRIKNENQINLALIERDKIQAEFDEKMKAYQKLLSEIGTGTTKTNTEVIAKVKKSVDDESKARFELAKFLAEQEIKRTEDVEQRVEKELQLEMFLIAERLKEVKAGSVAEALIIEQGQARINEIIEKGNIDLIKIKQDNFKAIIDHRQIELNQEISAIKQAAIDRGQADAETDKQIARARRQASMDMIDFTIKQLEQELLIKGLSAEEEKKIYAEIAKYRLQLTDLTYDQLKDKDKTRLDEIAEGLELASELYREFSQAIIGIFNGISEARIQDIDRQIAALEKQTEREIELAGDNDRAKEEIEKNAEVRREQFEAQRRSEQRKAAIREKAAALAGAGINVALAVTKALSQGGFVLGIPWAAIVGALGALQIAAIAAKPIPQFAEGGTTSTPLVIAGEQGRELYRTPSGVVGLTPDKATLMKMPLGTEIIPHDETMKMLAMSGIRQDVSKDYAMMEQIRSLEQTVSRGNKDLIKAVIESAPGDLFMQGSLMYEGKKRADGSRKLIRRKTFGY